MMKIELCKKDSSYSWCDAIVNGGGLSIKEESSIKLFKSFVSLFV